MHAHHQDGAQAPGADTPTRENAPAIDRGAETERVDFAKDTATAMARAALLGIEAHRIGPAAWMLRHAHGACIGAVYGAEALTAAVAGFEAARIDVLAIIRTMWGA